LWILWIFFSHFNGLQTAYHLYFPGNWWHRTSCHILIVHPQSSVRYVHESSNHFKTGSFVLSCKSSRPLLHRRP
jgi:hypothetical protein